MWTILYVVYAIRFNSNGLLAEYNYSWRAAEQMGGYRGVVSKPARGCVLDSRSVSVLLYVVYGMQVVVCTLECFVSIAASGYYVGSSVARVSPKCLGLLRCCVVSILMSMSKRAFVSRRSSGYGAAVQRWEEVESSRVAGVGGGGGRIQGVITMTRMIK
jgi:hypothetical protein